jgi:hypothetical protein
MINFRRPFFIALLLSLVIIVVVHTNPRRLRFFDPDHRHCGNSKEAHQWAIHAVYGARMAERGYYNRLTVSTSEELPRQKLKLHKVLQTLAHVAQKTGRAIRVNQSLIPGYVSEHMQPYSLVNAQMLHKYGIEVVEIGYWHRATQAQNVKGNIVAKHVNLQEDPIGVLTNLYQDEGVHELIFSVDELLNISDDDLLRLVGGGLGFDFHRQQWKQPLVCGHEEIKDKNPIPILNDPLLP